MKSILITGGARSGKSRFAQDIAAKLGGTVLFVATAEPKDEEMRLRIKMHKESRPGSWRTLEVPLRIGANIREHIGNSEIVIVDCITVLVSNVLLQADDRAASEEIIFKEIEILIESMDSLAATFILVSNEVGLGLVPDNDLGRRYRDCLGKANQMLARHADEVHFLVAGISIRLK
ncbi:bifunctional adenosylcobinamide kinase/adenosylcobinamide-phosphate guanylyltransferase [Chloroflexota bacterium]